MSEIFLSRQDIALLAGRQRRADQVAQLRVMGVPFFINAAGWPVVTRAAVEGRQSKVEPPSKRWEPRVISA
jgi:hypothetical protein